MVTPYPSRRSRGWALGLTIVLGVWTVAVVVAPHAVVWLLGDTLVIEGLRLPLVVWPLVSLCTGLLVAVPAVLLAHFSPVPFARIAGRQWLLCALFGAVLGVARLVPATYHEVYLAVLAALAAVAAAVHMTITGRLERAATDRWMRWLSLAAGLLLLLPWLWVGALGGAVETVLALVAALALGWLATRPMLALTGRAAHGNAWAGTALAGLLAGVGLVPLAAGIGEPAVQLLALLCVPPVAFALAALRHKGEPSVAAVLTPVLFGPLALVDPDETSLILGLRDGLFWGAVGAVAAGTLAVLAAIAVLIAFRRATWRPWAAAVLAAVVAVGGAVVYTALGRPGFAGEHLFVVMREQADLSDIPGSGSQPERVRRTYERLVATAERTQAPLRAALRAKHLSYTPFYLLNGVEVDAGPVARQWLAGRSDVAHVLLNPRLRPLPATAPPMHGSVTTPPSSPLWNLTLIGANQVWSQYTTGRGIVVGSSDSGVDFTHPALRGNYRGGDDSWLDPYGPAGPPTDNSGHGTHTMATAVGAGVGVAPGAQWMACENLPRNLGSMANYLTCLQFMLAPYARGADPWHAGHPDRAPQVLTNSWGCPSVEGCDLYSMRPAIEAFTAAGIFFVAAAGNTGPRCSSITDPPSNYAATLTVGAVDRDSHIAEFSSRGPTPDGLTKPDITAPGVDVLSALPGGGYGFLSGTSMATPHVAGVVALMWSANPALVGNIPETRAILARTARPLDPGTGRGSNCGTPADTVGAGLIDALSAVRAAVAVKPAAP